MPLLVQVISAITPRPIAFISSMDSKGVVNVSPYSYFNVMSHDPIHITIGEPHLALLTASDDLKQLVLPQLQGYVAAAGLCRRAGLQGKCVSLSYNCRSAMPCSAGHAHSTAQRENGHKDSLQNILDTGCDCVYGLLEYAAQCIMLCRLRPWTDSLASWCVQRVLHAHHQRVVPGGSQPHVRPLRPRGGRDEARKPDADAIGEGVFRNHISVAGLMIPLPATTRLPVRPGQWPPLVSQCCTAACTPLPAHVGPCRASTLRTCRPLLLFATQVKVPRIAEAAVQMECKLRSTYDVVNKCALFVQSLPEKLYFCYKL